MPAAVSLPSQVTEFRETHRALSLPKNRPSAITALRTTIVAPAGQQMLRQEQRQTDIFTPGQVAERLESALRMLADAAGRAATQEGMNREEFAHAIGRAGKRAFFFKKNIADWPDQYAIAGLLTLSQRVQDARRDIREIGRIVMKTQPIDGRVTNFLLRRFPQRLNELAGIVKEAGDEFAALSKS